MALPRSPTPFFASLSLPLVLCTVYLLIGQFGHDPWKSDDATHFGIVYSLLEEGHWLLPRLAGETWLGNPPLYYWIAAPFAKLFGTFVPLHDAARLTSGFFGALTLLFLSRAAHLFGNGDSAPSAALVAIGCLGLLVHVHEAQPAMAYLAAAAAAYWGIALVPQQPLRGGTLVGAGVGLAFLAVGLPALLTLAPLLALLPFACTPLRATAAARAVLAAFAAATPLVLAWPLALAFAHPDGLALWWAREMDDLRPSASVSAALWAHLKLLAWFAWPALPLALWTLWRMRRRLAEPRTLIPLVSFLVAFAVQAAFFEARPPAALPLLPALILLAAPATVSLRRGAANAFDWFAMMTFTLIAALIWLGWVAMVAGVPPRIAHNFAKLEPGFVASFSLWAFIAALALSLTWLWLIFRSPRAPTRSAMNWAAGIVLTWGLLVTLWMPWIDYGKSYRAVAAALKAAIPARSGCIAGHELGDSQRASFHYFAGIKTLNEDHPKAARCRLVLTQATTDASDLPRGAGWRKIWEGHRPGDRVERFRLYQKN